MLQIHILFAGWLNMIHNSGKFTLVIQSLLPKVRTSLMVCWKCMGFLHREKFQECNKTKHQTIQWVYSFLQISTSTKQTLEVPVAGSPLRHQSFTTGFSPLNLFCPGSRSSRRWGLVIPASFEGRRYAQWSWDSWKRVVILLNLQQDLMNGPRIEGPEWAPNFMVYMGLTNISQLGKRKNHFQYCFFRDMLSNNHWIMKMNNRPAPPQMSLVSNTVAFSLPRIVGERVAIRRDRYNHRGYPTLYDHAKSTKKKTYSWRQDSDL